MADRPKKLTASQRSFGKRAKNSAVNRSFKDPPHRGPKPGHKPKKGK